MTILFYVVISSDGICVIYRPPSKVNGPEG